MTEPRAGHVLAALALCALPGCLWRSPGLTPGPRVDAWQDSVTLAHERVRLHFGRPRAAVAARPLVLFATGDGGWHACDRLLYRAFVAWGYPVVGFSAPNYLHHLKTLPGVTMPARVAADYRALIEFARHGLALPARTPVVLVGFSRGAGLAIVAAGQRELQTELQGVLALALTDEEEHVHRFRWHRARDGAAARRELVTLRPYEWLDHLGRLPLAVIQSTHDGYVPAARARRLFGPDSERRRLVAVDAAGHTFGGARATMLERAQAALEWIAGPGTPAATP